MIGHRTLIYLFVLLSFGIRMTAISRLLRSIIIGPPGSGKGTISERITKDFGNVHLSSGDVLRENIRNQTDVGKKAKRYIDNGSLVPDSIMVDLICSELQKLKGQSWLLDGFPRTVDQAESLMAREAVDTVLYMNVPFAVIIERIQGRLLHPGSGRIYHTEFNPPKVPMTDDLTGEPLIQRVDDRPETVMARLQSFQKQTQPVLDFYRKHGLLEEFKGKYSNEIWPEVHGFLSTKVEPLRFTKYA